jgi:hypothetical protein
LFYLRLLCRIVPTCVNRDMSITHRQVTYRHVLSWLVTANLFYLVSSSAVHLYRIICVNRDMSIDASSYVPICAILISYRTNLFDLVSSRPYRLFLCLSCIVRHSLALRIHLNYFDKSTYRLVLSVGYPLSLYRLLTRSILISHRSNSTCPISNHRYRIDATGLDDTMSHSWPRRYETMILKQDDTTIHDSTKIQHEQTLE